MRRLTVASQPEPKSVYTLEEARAILQLGRDSLRRIIDAGQLYTFSVGRARRIPAWAIEAFLRGTTDPGAENDVS